MTTVLSDIFDLDLFAQRIDEGYVRVRKHPTLELWTAGYTEKAQFDRVWDEVTNNCRGLIYDGSNTVIARPFPKFHNWDDAGQPYPPGGECYVSPKMDGSLGILYWDGTRWAIATRGSFESDQAKEATLMLEKQIGDDMYNPDKFDQTKTYLFEIIY